MSSPILRCAESTDLPRLLALVEAYYAFEGMRYAAEVQGEGLRQLLGNPSVGTVWLAEGPEGLLGYLVATWGFDLEWGGRQVTVTELFVAEGGRARGVGTALLAALGEALAKAGIGTVELQVATGNTAARGFYEARGFVAHERVPMSRAVAPRARSTRPPEVPVAVRSPVPEETDMLVELGRSTGLFTEEEADALLRGVLDGLHTGTLGEGHQVWVAASEGADVPMGWAYLAPGTHAAEVWDLWWIGVGPAWHGGGVGDRLLSMAESQARAAGGRVLVIETNDRPALARARAFYQRRGYELRGCIPDFYAPGEAKVIFSRSLSG